MSLSGLNAHGINAASITYDSPEILRRFADAYHIEYPMLSDVGSKVIREFGILNTNIPSDHPMLYGIPFSGDYLIAPDGRVREKLFLPNYEYRPSASQVVMHCTDGAGPNSVHVETDVLSATISLSTDRCFPGQELGISLEVLMKSGWHIYGEPLPKNYQATVVQFEGTLVGKYSIDMPPARPLMLKALGENLPVYEGQIRALGTIEIKWSPPIPAKFLEPLGPPIRPGIHQLTGILRFQACNDELCEVPQAVKFELPLTIEAGIPAPPKVPQE